MKFDRVSLLGVGVTCLVGCIMLLWPLLGNPPYGFYGPMKWVVAFASGAGAWAMWNVSKALLPLSVLLTASGGIELLGKMRREDWVPFNWGSLGLLILTAIIAIAVVIRDPASHTRTDSHDHRA